MRAVIALLGKFAFRVRTRALARQMDTALSLRRRGRAKRQAAARQAARTRFNQRMEGVKKWQKEQ